MVLWMGADENMLTVLVRKMLRMQHHANAEMMLAIHEGWKVYKRHNEKELPFTDYLKVRSFYRAMLDHSYLPTVHQLVIIMPRFPQYVKDMGIPPAAAHIFSAHQMSSCRMSTTESEGVVDPDGQCWEVKDLYIMDGSILPTSLGR